MHSLYEQQKKFQNLLLENNMYKRTNIPEAPYDDVALFQYHVSAMISELGEVLESDKRWKNYRNGKYDREQKLEEVADCFITMMNIAIFSGFGTNELYDAIIGKMLKNFNRVEKEIGLE